MHSFQVSVGLDRLSPEPCPSQTLLAKVQTNLKDRLEHTLLLGLCPPKPVSFFRSINSVDVEIVPQVANVVGKEPLLSPRNPFSPLNCCCVHHLGLVLVGVTQSERRGGAPVHAVAPGCCRKASAVQSHLGLDQLLGGDTWFQLVSVLRGAGPELC